MSDPILVTGAASGIGRATAERLHAAGTPVIGTDLRADGPAGVEMIACDLSDPAAIDTLVAALPARLAGVASVAGVPGTLPPATVLKVNLLAPRRLGAALTDRIAPDGAIVHVASVAQFRSTVPADEIPGLLDTADDALVSWLHDRGLDGGQTYDFSKQALVALAKRQARDGIAHRVRALTVSPGPTETPILDDFRATMGADRMAAAAQVVGRHATADDVAPAITFLLSESARWINAIDVLVDGGLLGIR